MVHKIATTYTPGWGFNNRHVFSHSSEDWKFRSNVSRVSSEASLLGFQTAAFSPYVLTWSSLCVSVP